MHFAHDNIGKRHLLTGMWIAAAGLAIEVPIVFTLLVLRPHPIRWGYLIADIILASTVVFTIFVQFLVMRARDQIILTPPLVFFATLATAFATAFLQVAAGGSNMIYLPILCLCMLYLAIVGDNFMRSAGLVVIVGLIFFSVYATGDRGANFLSVAIMNSSVVGLIYVMTSLGVTSIIQSYNIENGFRRINNFAHTSKDVTEALISAASVISSMPFVAGVGVVRWIGQSGTVIYQLGTNDGFSKFSIDNIGASALRSGTVMRKQGLVYVPCGKDDQGSVVMVVDFGRITWRQRLRVLEFGQGLMTSLLQMTNQINHVIQLEQSSRTDHLTGLANRRVLSERIDIELVRATRSQNGLSIAMLDLDHFKSYNDAFGHQAGDEALRIVTAAMSNRIRSQDLLSRYGGEEFCLVMPDTNLDGAVLILEELRQIVQVQNLNRTVTISAGVAHSRTNTSEELLIARADQALYKAKSTGRNKVVSIAEGEKLPQSKSFS